MFDVLDLIIPELPPDRRFQWLHAASTFGESDDETLHWSGIAFGRRSDPVRSRTICGVREAWLTLSLGRESTAAAVNNETWMALLAGIQFLLEVSSNWVVLIEADCDQHPLIRVNLTSRELVERLDEQRRRQDSSLAWIVRAR